MQQQTELKAKQETEQNARKDVETKPKIPSVGDLELTPEQWEILKEGGFIYFVYYSGDFDIDSLVVAQENKGRRDDTGNKVTGEF